MAEAAGLGEGSGPSAEPVGLGRSRRREVMTGLLLSFAGLALVSLLFPVNAPALVRALPAAGAGLLLLWVGGILMGNGMRKFGGRARRSPVASGPREN